MATIQQVLTDAFRHHQGGNLQAAEQLYRQILQVQPAHVDALHLLGLVCQRTGRQPQAIEYIRQAIQLKPDFADAHSNLGIMLRQLGRLEEAVACYREALRLRPDHAETHNNLGVALGEQKRFDEAIACYHQALRLKPGYAEALSNRGNALQALERPEEALASYDQALRLRPQYPEALSNRGATLQAVGRLEEALASCEQALRLRPDYPGALGNRGAVLQALGRPEEALASCEQALRLRPDYPEAHNTRGATLQALGRLEEAVASCEQALRLRPDYPEALSNRGAVLYQLGRLAEAVASCEQALRLKPDYAEAHNTRGGALQVLGRLEEAAASYDQAIRLRPHYPEARMNRGMAWLLQGDFERGWPEYEWRWQCKDYAGRPFPQPHWDGSALDGRTILLHAEQGLGDAIQFIRYAPLVKERGGRVIVECPPLLGLLGRCSGIDQLAAWGSGLPPFHVHVPLLSLPGIFRTTLASIPASVPYLFADPEQTERWRRELAETPGLKVGIVWQGNPTHKGDRWRSVPLTRFEPLARIPGVRLVSLQKGPGAEQLPALGGRFAVLDLGAWLQEDAWTFADTAAVVSNLDLVVSVDTAVAHLAGALGVPVWVALPFAPDWRWLLGRDDSPWYPTMRLFRQSKPGDWDHVFGCMARSLAERYASACPRGD